MYLSVLLGFFFLIASADILVRGAVGLARRSKISPLVIGMTIVAFGTSAPEFLVSLDAAMAGSSAMAMGNVIGSNLANMMLIVGVAALLRPVPIKRSELFENMLVLLGCSLLFAWFCFLGPIDMMQGGFLLLIMLVFLSRSYVHLTNKNNLYVKSHMDLVKAPQQLKYLWQIWMAIIIGLVGVVFGADLLVNGGVKMASVFGVSDEVIGLTVFAIGTSLPELAATAVAATRGHAEIGLGNVIGSNLFNILVVVGGVALVAPLAAPQQILDFDLWLMLAVTITLFLFVIGNRKICRLVGSFLLISYIAYVFAQAHGISTLFRHLKLNIM